MSQVDIFSPFRRRTEHHEDRLTWGLLVALKYAPSLQSLLRTIVLREVPPDRWPNRVVWEPAAISTQTARVGPDAAFVISVLISDDTLPEVVPVDKSARTARYDGVVEYQDGLVLIVENKPRSAHVRKDQLSPSRASFRGLPVEVFERAVSLEWAEVLEGVLSCTASPLASYADKAVAGDFLAFAQELHPSLSPYRTFELCGDRPEALARRVDLLTSAVAHRISSDVGVRPGGRRFVHLANAVVQQVHFALSQSHDQSGPSLTQSIWPADTVAQARAFFNRVDPSSFWKLDADGWKIESNLHFSHMQKHLVWARPHLPVRAYLDLFTQRPELIGRTLFEDVPLDDLISRWRDFGLLSPPDIVNLRQEFGETRRSFINLIPGLRLSRELSLSRAIELEGEGRLEADLIEALRKACAAWGEDVRAPVSA